MKFYTESTFSLESLNKLVILHCFDFESSQNLLLLGYDGQEKNSKIKKNRMVIVMNILLFSVKNGFIYR